MEVEYKRDINHNYLIIKGEESEMDVDSYEVRMMMTNSIQGLLGCSIQGMDSQRLLYYEITSKQSVASIYENKKLGNVQIRTILQGMVSILVQMEAYLMDSAHILIDPSYMYLDAQQEHVYFCYLPMYEKSFTSSFREWMEYLLPRINHEDQQAVMLGYGVYRHAMEDNFNLEEIRQELFQKKEKANQESNQKSNQKANQEFHKGGRRGGNQEKESEEKESEEKESEEALRQQALEEFFEEEEFEEARIPYVLLGGLLLGGVVLFGGCYLLREYRLLSALQIQVGVGVLLLFSGMAGWLYHRKQKKELEILMEAAIQPKPDKKRKREKNRESRESDGIDGIEEIDEIDETDEMDEIKEMKKEDILYGETTLLTKAGNKQKESRLEGVLPLDLGTIVLREGSTIIGKLEAAVDVYIPLPTISRLHSKVKRENGRDYVMDLNSKNGTFVNDRLLEGEEAYELQEGDQVRFADVIYSYHI